MTNVVESDRNSLGTQSQYEQKLVHSQQFRTVAPEPLKSSVYGSHCADISGFAALLSAIAPKLSDASAFSSSSLL
jgi:hypothetical protein